MRNLRYLVWVAALTAWGIVAAETEKPVDRQDGNACTWISTIDDWRRLDDRNLLVWVSKHEVYHVELTLPLFELNSADAIAFVDHNRDGRLCGFGMDEVVVPRASVFASSTIANMTRLDDAALAELAERYKVKLQAKKPALAVKEAHPS